MVVLVLFVVGTWNHFARKFQDRLDIATYEHKNCPHIRAHGGTHLRTYLVLIVQMKGMLRTRYQLCE